MCVHLYEIVCVLLAASINETYSVSSCYILHNAMVNVMENGADISWNYTCLHCWLH